MESTLEQKTYTVKLTETELGYFYWRMKLIDGTNGMFKKDKQCMGTLDGKNTR